MTFTVTEELLDHWKQRAEQWGQIDWRKYPDCEQEWPHPSCTNGMRCPACSAREKVSQLERFKARVKELCQMAVGEYGWDSGFTGKVLCELVGVQYGDEVEAGLAPSEKTETAGVARTTPFLQEVVQDYRIGLTMRCRERSHRLYYERGEVVYVHPDGTAGLACKDGVLVLRMAGGSVVMEPADQWVAAQ